MPRKKANEASTYPHRVWARVSVKRYNALKQLLNESYLDTMSELIRDVLDNRPIKVKTFDNSKIEVLKTIASINKELNAIGVNINQLTKAFHESTSDTQKVIMGLKIAERYKEVEGHVKVLQITISELSKSWLQK